MGRLPRVWRVNLFGNAKLRVLSYRVRALAAGSGGSEDAAREADSLKPAS
jgi:hypothetical protein